MLTFLRKIRRSLIDSGSVHKYLVYAIGEIALVVIGILIALQINNWTEKRQNTEHEITILRNIKKDINLDTIDLAFNYKYHKRFYEAELAFMNLLMSEKGYLSINDSIDYSDVLGARLWTALHKSTFNNLQSNEVDLLKNNVIRKEISRFYDFYQQVMLNMANHFEDFDLYKQKLPYFKKYFRVVPGSRKYLLLENASDYFDHKLFKNEIILHDLDGAQEDESFIFTMNEVLFFRRAFIDFHQAMLQEISILNELIDEEIINLEKSL